MFKTSLDTPFAFAYVQCNKLGLKLFTFSHAYQFVNCQTLFCRGLCFSHMHCLQMNYIGTLVTCAQTVKCHRMQIQCMYVFTDAIDAKPVTLPWAKKRGLGW